MDPQTVELVLRALQTTAIAAVLFAAWTYIPKLQYKVHVRKLPSLTSEGSTKARDSFMASAKKLYQDGYEKVCFGSALRTNSVLTDSVIKFKDSAYTLINENGKSALVAEATF